MCIGKDTFGLLRALIAPAKLVDKTYNDLTTALSSHLAPKPLVIAERFRFIKGNRKYQGVCSEFAEVGRALQFWRSTHRNLKRQVSVRHEERDGTETAACKEDLTFAKALELAETEERASKDAEQLHSRAQQEVHRVRQFHPALRPEGKDKGPANCYRCGGKHEQHVCKFRFETCRYCKKKGHIVRVCRRKQADTEGAGKKKLDTSVKDLGEDDSQGEDDSYQAGWKPVHGIRAMKQWKKQSPMFVEIKV